MPRGPATHRWLATVWAGGAHELPAVQTTVDSLLAQRDVRAPQVLVATPRQHVSELQRALPRVRVVAGLDPPPLAALTAAADALSGVVPRSGPPIYRVFVGVAGVRYRPTLLRQMFQLNRARAVIQNPPTLAGRLHRPSGLLCATHHLYGLRDFLHRMPPNALARAPDLALERFWRARQATVLPGPANGAVLPPALAPRPPPPAAVERLRRVLGPPRPSPTPQQPRRLRWISSEHMALALRDRWLVAGVHRPTLDWLIDSVLQLALPAGLHRADLTQPSGPPEAALRGCLYVAAPSAPGLRDLDGVSRLLGNMFAPRAAVAAAQAEQFGRFCVRHAPYPIALILGGPLDQAVLEAAARGLEHPGWVGAVESRLRQHPAPAAAPAPPEAPAGGPRLVLRHPQRQRLDAGAVMARRTPAAPTGGRCGLAAGVALDPAGWLVVHEPAGWVAAGVVAHTIRPVPGRASVWGRGSDGRPWLCHLPTREVTPLRCDGDSGGAWMPFVHAGAVCFVVSLMPLRLVRANEAGDCEAMATRTPKPPMALLPGTNLVPWGGPVHIGFAATVEKPVRAVPVALDAAAGRLLMIAAPITFRHDRDPDGDQRPYSVTAGALGDLELSVRFGAAAEAAAEAAIALDPDRVFRQFSW